MRAKYDKNPKSFMGRFWRLAHQLLTPAGNNILQHSQMMKSWQSEKKHSFVKY